MRNPLAAKLAVVAALALLLLIPILMVQGKIAERATYRNVARNDVARSWTGPQQIMTPVVVLSYTIETQAGPGEGQALNTRRNRPPVRRRGHRILVIDQNSVSVELVTEQLRKGIYRIPVYSANVDIAGTLDSTRINAEREDIAALPGFIEHNGASFSLALGDPRGISEPPSLDWGGTERIFKPGSGIPGLPSGVHTPLLLMETDSISNYRIKLSLNGMESLQFVPAALDATFEARSGWPHPKFDGAFLPINREIGDQGFRASWRVNQFSSGIDTLMKECAIGDCDVLDGIAFGVTLVDPVDVYLQSERATKYAMLFIGLSFVACFVFETLRELRIHPIQYALVGLALSVFYLLLISLSEHIAFGHSYAIAALACVSLLVYYVQRVLEGWRGAGVFGAMLGLLYSALYVIIQAEDFALLGGAALVFVVLGTVMVVTRDIDWYRTGKPVQE